MPIHPTAIISPQAHLGKNVSIGPYAIIGADVVLEDEVSVGAHCVIEGPTRIGRGTRLFPFVSVGQDPQDLKYAGERTELIIGERNVIREFATLHRGTGVGGGVTRIGNDNLLMAQCHVAHDCVVGNHIIMANGASLAGHVEVHDHAILGAYVGVHQFCRVGTYAFIGAYSVVVKDALPYARSVGNHARCYGPNSIGLRRAGFPDTTCAPSSRLSACCSTPSSIPPRPLLPSRKNSATIHAFACYSTSLPLPSVALSSSRNGSAPVPFSRRWLHKEAPAAAARRRTK